MYGLQLIGLTSVAYRAIYGPELISARNHYCPRTILAVICVTITISFKWNNRLP